MYEQEVLMSRVQLALNVDDIDTAVAFYSKLFGAQPAKRRPGYANFALDEPALKLVLMENPGQGGSLNHLGVELSSTEQVDAALRRAKAQGFLADEERGTTCCYATQDKFWVTGPDGERWEHYVVLADSATFRAEPAADATQCCETPGAADTSDAPDESVAAACC
jgi:catechol 2,3-dioxygenase-like lactoylglutathione lyase family enzyme